MSFIYWPFLCTACKLQAQGLQFASISNFHFHLISSGLFLHCELCSGNKGEYGMTLGAISYVGGDVPLAVCIAGALSF